MNVTPDKRKVFLHAEKAVMEGLQVPRAGHAWAVLDAGLSPPEQPVQCRK